MAVQSTHLNANLRMQDTDRKHVMSLHRANPNITSQSVTHIVDAVQSVRGQMLGGVNMTVTSVLTEV